MSINAYPRKTKPYRISRSVLLAFLLVSPVFPAKARPLQLPGPADAARVAMPVRQLSGKLQRDEEISTPQIQPALLMTKIPAGKRFVLKRVNIEGVTLFPDSALKDIYTPYLDHPVSLEIGWMMTGMLQERYRHAGHSFTRAYIEPASLKSGIMTIQVIEKRPDCRPSPCPRPDALPL